MTIAFGELRQLVVFPLAALAWLACQGVVHFVIGRYCNYKSNQLMGVNLIAPVVTIFALGAAMCYGSSPLMARQAFLHAPGISTAAGGCLAYAAATLFFPLILFKPGSSADIKSVKRENLPWFLSSAVLVAISQAFVYASLAVAPLMVVTPILQLSLVFRLFLSQLINRDHEVMNAAVLIGACTAVLGSILVSLDTEELTTFLDLPLSLADFLRYGLAGH